MSRYSPQPFTQGASQDVTIKPSINTLAQGSMFWQPEYRRASPWLEHTPFLFWLVEAIQPRACVGLGVDAVSHLAICQAVKRLRLDTHNYLITGSENETLDEAARELGAEEYATSSHWLATTPTRAIKQFDEGSIDLLVLNVAPDDDSVDYLVDRWLSRLSTQGVVLLPGVARREPGCQVFRLFEAMKAHYPHFTFHHGDGLGVIAIGQEYSSLLENLFNAVESPASSQVVQDIFARLGRSCRDKLSVQEQRTLVQQLETRVTEHQAQWKEAETQRGELSEQLAKANQDRKDLKNRIASQEERFAHERGRLSERVSSLEEFNGELKNELMRQRNQHEQREAERREQSTALKEALAAIEEKKAALETSKKEAATAEKARQKLEGVLEETRQEHESTLEATRQEHESALEETRRESATRFEELARLTTLLEEKEGALKQLEIEKADELSRARQDLEHHQQESRTRFEELAKLTTLLESQEQALEQERREAERVRAELVRHQAERETHEQHAQTALETSREVERLERELTRQREQAQAFADERFQELAILTTLLEKKETEYQQEIDRQARELAVLSGGNTPILSSSLNETITANEQGPASPTLIKKELPLSKRAIKRQAALIESSPHFDAQWYLAQYPDVAADPRMSAHPARHYLMMGGFEGRNPGPTFDSAYYLATHDDVAQSGINPLIHYIKFGEKEQRSIRA